MIACECVDAIYADFFQYFFVTSIKKKKKNEQVPFGTNVAFFPFWVYKLDTFEVAQLI